MDEAQLLEQVAVEHRLEVKRLLAAYLSAQTATDASAAHVTNIEGFAHVLHQRGLLSAEGLKEFMTYHALDVGEVDVDAEDTHKKRYELMTLLGAGAMGEVFLGRDPSLKRTVAVKRAHREMNGDPVLLRRFLTEAQVTAQLDHPAIVPVYSLERDESGAFTYAMKFVRGVTLTQYLDDARAQLGDGKGRPDAAHALHARVECFIPVLNAVAYAHRRGVVHRDLKPDNIMVGSFGQVLVMDWGIARLLGRGDADATSPPVYAELPPELSGKLTVAGAILGTPAYMSPEQASGREVSTASDQYTLGLILQEIVSLRQAMRGDTASIVLLRAMRGLREVLHDTGGERVPRELRAIIAKATALEPRARYPSVAAMAADVQRWLRDESVEADPDRGLRRVTRWIGKHRGLAMAIAAMLALGGFATVMVLVRQNELAVIAERDAARAREAAVAAVAAAVDTQAERMSQRLQRYESLLEGLASAAAVVLRAPAPPSSAVAYQYADGKHDPAELPFALAPSPAYKQPATLRAELAAAWGVDRSAARARIDQLARMEPIMRTTLLRSLGEDAVGMPFAEAERRVLEDGAPLVFTYLYTDDGFYTGLPGTWETYDSPGGVGWDHRREDWYTDAMKTRGPGWTVASDGSQFGLTVSCLTTIRDDQGVVLGVAGVDIWFDRFIAELLEVPALRPRLGGASTEAFLLDKSGAVLVRSSDKLVGARGADWVPKPYEDEALRTLVLTGPASGTRALEGRLAAWTRLGSADLVYLVVGDEAQMLAAMSASATTTTR